MNLLQRMIISGIFLICIIFYFFYKKSDIINNKIFSKDSLVVKEKVYKTNKIQKVVVTRGDTFDLTTNGGRYLLKLKVSAVEEAKDKVIDILNHSTNPKCMLLEKQADGHWTGNFIFTYEDKDWDLANWLEVNKLVYK